MHETPAARDSSDASAEPANHAELPPAWATRLLIAANVLVYLAVAIAAGDFVSPPTPALLAWGANFAPAVADGEFWRPVTSMFLHGGLIHLGLNMWVLSSIGPFMERLFGVTTFLLIYLLAGLSGSVASLAWHPATVGVGASGAIFGLFGALLGFLFVRRHVIPADTLNALLKNGLYFLGINLLLGFTIPNVDVAAHLGGAAGGLLGGLAATWPLAKTPRSAWLVRNALLALLIALVAAATPLCLTESVRAQRQFMAAIDRFDEEYPVLLDRFKKTVRQESGDEDLDVAAERFEKEILQPWQEMSRQFPPQNSLPQVQRERPVTAVIYRYLETMEESFALMVKSLRTHDMELTDRAADKFVEAQNLLKEFQEK